MRYIIARFHSRIASKFAVASPNGAPARLAYISEFIEEAKASGLVQRVIEREGASGDQVAK